MFVSSLCARTGLCRAGINGASLQGAELSPGLGVAVPPLK